MLLTSTVCVYTTRRLLLFKTVYGVVVALLRSVNKMFERNLDHFHCEDISL